MIDPTYVAAWPDARTRTMFELAGVTKKLHMTTCFDKAGRLAAPEIYVTGLPLPEHGLISGIEEWQTGKGRIVVALIATNGWAHKTHAFMEGQLGRPLGVGLRAYRPHITLAKGVGRGAAQALQFLVGSHVWFDRHGFEV